MKKGLSRIAAALLLIAVCAVMTACGSKETKGAKAVTVTVVDNNQAETSYSVNTDAEFLSQVFDEIDDLSVEGTTSEYGLYIETVNGLTADYATDGAYWSIYVNGEYGQYGADSQPVADGDTYTLQYEVYVAE